MSVDDWDVDDSDSDTDLTMNPKHAGAILKIFITKPPPPVSTPAPLVIGPVFLCRIGADLPADIVRVDDTSLNATYTLYKYGDAFILRVFYRGDEQCNWRLTVATDPETVEAWKPEKTPEKTILRATSYDWVEERAFVMRMQYRNQYSGDMEDGEPESVYGSSIFSHECKTV